MKTSTLPIYRSADFSERKDNSEFGDLCIAAAIRGEERELSEKMASAAFDWQLSESDREFLLRVQGAFRARLLKPKCAVKQCRNLGFVLHGRRFCVRHWDEVQRLAFAQRVDWLGIVDDFVLMYGKKVPAPRR